MIFGHGKTTFKIKNSIDFFKLISLLPTGRTRNIFLKCLLSKTLGKREYINIIYIYVSILVCSITAVSQLLKEYTQNILILTIHKTTFSSSIKHCTIVCLVLFLFLFILFIFFCSCFKISPLFLE